MNNPRVAQVCILITDLSKHEKMFLCLITPHMSDRDSCCFLRANGSRVLAWRISVPERAAGSV